jgi:CCR4-NOT transcription complex subunit 1
MLAGKPFVFSIELALLAARRDYLNFDKFIDDHIKNEGDSYIRSCLEYINDKVSALTTGKAPANYTVDGITNLLRLLHLHDGY